MRRRQPPSSRNWWDYWASSGCFVTNFTADAARMVV